MWICNVCSSYVILIGNGYVKKRVGDKQSRDLQLMSLSDFFPWLEDSSVFVIPLFIYCLLACILSGGKWCQNPWHKEKSSWKTTGIPLLFSKIRPALYSFLYLPYFLLLSWCGLFIDLLRKGSEEVLLFLLTWWWILTQRYSLSSFVVIMNSSPLKIWYLQFHY